MAMVLPSTEVIVTGFRSQMQYRTMMDDKILWDECARYSDFPTYQIKIKPTISSSGPTESSGPFEMTFKGYYSEMLDASEMQMQVFELDSQCHPAAQSVYDEITAVQTETLQSYGCSSNIKMKVLVSF
jgi:hypothetical protein